MRETHTLEARGQHPVHCDLVALLYNIGDLFYTPNQLMKLFTHHTKVYQSQMNDLAVQIMDELYDETSADLRRKQMLRLLHSSEISVQTVCTYGKTLGFYLAREMSAPILQTYQELGGDLCARDKQGNTMMFEALSGFAIFLGNEYDTACIDLLIQNGLDINHTNVLGQTPIFGLREALNIYNVGQTFSANGPTNLLEPRIVEYIDVLEWAQQKGANLRHTDNNGQTVFDMAHGVEFSPLRNQLEMVRATLEKESILKNLSAPTTVSQRKI